MAIKIVDTDLIRAVSSMQIADMNHLFMTFAPKKVLAMTVKGVKCTHISPEPVFYL